MAQDDNWQPLFTNPQVREADKKESDFAKHAGEAGGNARTNLRNLGQGVADRLREAGENLKPPGVAGGTDGAVLPGMNIPGIPGGGIAEQDKNRKSHLEKTKNTMSARKIPFGFGKDDNSRKRGNDWGQLSFSQQVVSKIRQIPNMLVGGPIGTIAQVGTGEKRLGGGFPSPHKAGGKLLKLGCFIILLVFFLIVGGGILFSTGIFVFLQSIMG